MISDFPHMVSSVVEQIKNYRTQIQALRKRETVATDQDQADRFAAHRRVLQERVLAIAEKAMASAKSNRQ